MYFHCLAFPELTAEEKQLMQDHTLYFDFVTHDAGIYCDQAPHQHFIFSAKDKKEAMDLIFDYTSCSTAFVRPIAISPHLWRKILLSRYKNCPSSDFPSEGEGNAEQAVK